MLMNLTISQASEYLGIHPDTLRRWEKKGLIKSQRVGKRKDRRYNRKDLDKLKSKANSIQEKKDMENFVLFMLSVSNMRNIPRYGPLLFSGINSSSIPEHIHLVSIIVSALVDDFRGLGYEINGERLYKVVLTHDLGEAIIGDIPTASPSYQSFFDVDIRKIFKDAEQKAIDEMLSLVENKALHEREDSLSEIEKDILDIADTLALLFEMINLKFTYNHEWIDMMWNNSIKRVNKYTKQYSFVGKIIDVLEDVYKRDKKPANPLLTKAQFNQSR
jgi:excisionase family DNA binding protein